jgi:hypothetical protein
MVVHINKGLEQMSQVGQANSVAGRKPRPRSLKQKVGSYG